MNENTEKLIRELAEKLGTTSEKLYGVLVQQAPIEAVTSLFSLFFLIVCFTLVFKFIENKTKKNPVFDKNGKPVENYDGEHYLKSEWEPDDLLPFMTYSILTILFVFICLQVVDTFQICTTAFMNPEYWALKQILNLL